MVDVPDSLWVYKVFSHKNVLLFKMLGDDVVHVRLAAGKSLTVAVLQCRYLTCQGANKSIRNLNIEGRACQHLQRVDWLNDCLRWQIRCVFVCVRHSWDWRAWAGQKFNLFTFKDMKVDKKREDSWFFFFHHEVSLSSPSLSHIAFPSVSLVPRLIGTKSGKVKTLSIVSIGKGGARNVCVSVYVCCDLLLECGSLRVAVVKLA